MDTDQLDSDISESKQTKKRRPVIALLLSLFCPGLGHLYAGSLRLSIIWFVSFFLITNFLLAVLIYWNSNPLNIIIPVFGYLILYLSNIISSYRLASRQPKVYLLKSFNKIYLYILLFIVYELVLILFWPVFENYEAYKMPSQSMMNALYVGEYLIADHDAYEYDSPGRNDFVIFIYPRDGQTKYIKRVIGLPGDTVEVVDKKLYINNRLFDLPPTVIYLDTLSDGSPKIQPRQNGFNCRDNYGPYVVPAKSYFVLGDNWDNSWDSRYWGVVPHENLIGKAIRVTYSNDWSRIGMKLE